MSQSTDRQNGSNPTLLMEKMLSPDKDLRFMAVNDLITYLKNSDSRLGAPLGRALVNSLIELIEDKSGEVQSLTVKCLGHLIHRIQDDLVNQVLFGLINKLAGCNDSDIRGVCCVGLKTVIGSLRRCSPDSSSSSAVSSVIQQTTLPLVNIVSDHADANVRLDACEALVELILRFGSLLHHYHVELVECMLLILSPNSHQAQSSPLTKRSIQSLELLAKCIPTGLLGATIAFLLLRLGANQPPTQLELAEQYTGPHNVLFQRQKIHTALHLIPVTATDQPALRKKALIMALNGVAGSVARVPYQVEPIARLVVHCLQGQQHGGGCCYSEDESLQALILQLFETLVSRSPSKMEALVNELLPTIVQCMQFDPNYNYEAANQQMSSGSRVDGADDDMNGDYFDGDENDDDDEADYSDDEDESWKVRHTAVRLLQVILQSYPDSIAALVDLIGSQLISQFREHQETVRLAVFAATSTMIHQVRHSTLALVAHPQQQQQQSSASSLSPSGGGQTTSNNDQLLSKAMLKQLRSQLTDPNSVPSRLIKLIPLLQRAILHQLLPGLVKVSSNQLLMPDKQHLVFSSDTMRTAVQKQISPAVQHSAFMLFRDVTQSLPGECLDDYAPLVLTFVNHAFSSSSNPAKCDLVNLVCLLVNTHLHRGGSRAAAAPNDCWMESNMNFFVKLAICAITDRFYRVTLEGLSLVELLLSKPMTPADDTQLYSLAPEIRKLLQQRLGDCELKDKILHTSALYIRRFGKTADGEEMKTATSLTYQALLSDTTRLSAVKSVEIIVSTPYYQIRDLCPPPVNELAKFLSKSDRLLRLAVLRCMLAIWKVDVDDGNCDCLKGILDTFPAHLISEQDLQTSQLCFQILELLLETTCMVRAETASQFITSQTFINSITSLVHSPLLRGQALRHLVNLLVLIGRTLFAKCNQVMSTYLCQFMSPIDPTGLQSSRSATAANQPISSPSRDAIPGVARCVAALLASLPMSSSSENNNNSSTLASVDEAVKRLVSVFSDQTGKTKDAKFSLLRYLYILVLGELGRLVDLSHNSALQKLLLNLVDQPTTADEMRPAAGVSLGRFILGSPSLALLPSHILHQIDSKITSTGTDTHSSVFPLLLALREVLSNAAQPEHSKAVQSQLPQIWSLLVKSSVASEEGSRNLVAECLARLLLLLIQWHPSNTEGAVSTLIKQLTDQLGGACAARSNSGPPHSYTRSTLITTFKYLLTVSQISSPDDQDNDDDDAAGSEVKHPSSRQDSLDLLLTTTSLPICLEHLSDPDLTVRRSALVLLNTTAHHRPALVRSMLQSDPGLARLLYAETAIRTELIREVSLGPFKHKEDDGLELRKCAFECMSTLLDSCLDRLNTSDFLEPLIAGCADHTDVKLLCFPMIQRLAYLQSHSVVQKLDKLVEPLNTVLISKPKGDWVMLELEKKDELNRSALRVVATFKIALEDIDQQIKFVNLIRVIKADPKLKEQFQQQLADVSAANSSAAMTSGAASSPTGRRTTGRL